MDSALEKRIHRACKFYCVRNGYDPEGPVFYVKLNFVKRKLEAQPSLIEKILDRDDPTRVHDLLRSNLSMYDETLKKFRDDIIHQTQKSTVEVNWETTMTCPKCKQKKYTTKQVQTRSIDEATTIKAKCICGFQFTI